MEPIASAAPIPLAEAVSAAAGKALAEPATKARLSEKAVELALARAFQLEHGHTPAANDLHEGFLGHEGAAELANGLVAQALADRCLDSLGAADPLATPTAHANDPYKALWQVVEFEPTGTAPAARRSERLASRVIELPRNCALLATPANGSALPARRDPSPGHPGARPVWWARRRRWLGGQAAG